VLEKQSKTQKRPARLFDCCQPPPPPKGSSGNVLTPVSVDSSQVDMDEFQKLLARKSVGRADRDHLHRELLYNRENQLNDGPACRCSINARKTGIRHGIFPGEKPLKLCNQTSNYSNELYCYRLVTEPSTNYVSDNPTKIEHDGGIYRFDGFSILSHEPLVDLLPCKMTRFNIEYTIELRPEEMPDNFNIQQLELFKSFLFTELLELYDLDWRTHGDNNGCQRFHVYPRFLKRSQDGHNQYLPIDALFKYLVKEHDSLMDEARYYGEDWLDYRRRYKDMIVWAPAYRPSALRIDQIDFEDNVPVLIHFSSRPPQLSFAANPQYQRASKELLKFRHLLANKPKVSYSDKRALAQKEEKLREFKAKAEVKNDTVILCCDRFYTTGLHCDIVQHAMIIPVVIYQIRFQHSLECLEKIIGHSFSDKYLLQLALTHPSYRENYGTNPDHARNTLNNLGFRQLVYGDTKISHQTRKRGINTLFNIMSRFGCQEETMSNIQHNERLEFLGDAVVEFLTSIHLFFMFPELEEGGLATYRAALVQNQHLAVLAKKLQLEKFMLYAHGSDLCHDLELRHAMANCFEALMAALFLDAGLDVADKVLANVLFDDEPELLKRWVNYPKHPLQMQNVDGDRFLIKEIPLLEKLTEFEAMTGIEFKHVRLLARAFTHRSIGFNNLTLGTNQRMEFLGDTVLQLIASEYLYKHFPGHHEGHLSLLRSSLVNNRTQTVVCDDLGMAEYLNHRTKGPLRTKDRADLLEAFIGALYVDGGLDKCRAFCAVCFFPRLEDFIIHQSWNDPKSKLQQCCLTLRSLESREPDIPVYKVVDTIGPTNTRVYKVAVYFKDRRLATGEGPSIQDAEMAAATNALKQYRDQFPELGSRRKISNMDPRRFSSYQQSSSPPPPPPPPMRYQQYRRPVMVHNYEENSCPWSSYQRPQGRWER
jgi:ribonuclease-3